MDKYNNLMINYEENVLFYEIEENDSFDYDVLSDEERKEIDTYNDEKIKEITKTLLDTIIPDGLCRCMMQDFFRREMSKTKLINPNAGNAINASIRQEDVDAFKFAIIVVTKDGKYDTVNTVIRECKKCHKIEYWGSVEVFSHMLGEATVNFINNTGKDDDEVEEVVLPPETPNADAPEVFYEDIEEDGAADELVYELVEVIDDEEE